MKMDEHIPTMAGLFDMLNPGRSELERHHFRHGPYNSVSGEKYLEKGLVWSKNVGKSSHQHKQKTKQKRNQNDPQIPQPDLRFAKKQTAKQQRTGPGPNKNQTKQLEICLEYSDLSHCIVIKNMQTN